MSLITILVIFLIAIVLLFIELMLIPGFGIAGISSIILSISGVISVYINYGNNWGNFALVASIVFFIIFVWFALRQNTWKRLSLKTDIDSKAPNIEGIQTLKIGDVGYSKSRLGPIGEIDINGINVEAQSLTGIINAGEQIEIVNIINNKIIVKTKNA